LSAIWNVPNILSLVFGDAERLREMTGISIREASPEDAPVVTRFIRFVLEETASMGGHKVAKADEEWKRILREEHPERITFRL
jgi:hypothetical protein